MGWFDERGKSVRHIDAQPEKDRNSTTTPQNDLPKDFGAVFSAIESTAMNLNLSMLKKSSRDTLVAHCVANLGNSDKYSQMNKKQLMEVLLTWVTWYLVRVFSPGLTMFKASSK